jgi:UDP-galactopyranose mutase
VARVGRDLYEKFFRGYTRKQWGVDPSELDKSVTARVPVRTNQDDRYFRRHVSIHARAGLHAHVPAHAWTTRRSPCRSGRISATSPQQLSPADLYRTIDEFFDYRFGPLPYRSLRFRHLTLDKQWHQPVAVVNYPQTHDYTRVTEYKHLTGQTHAKTSVTYEFPCDDGDPYYPVPRPENAELYKKYEQLALAAHDVWFAGRLATYRYYNMDQVVGQALSTFARINRKLPLSSVTGGYQPDQAAAAPAT